MRFSLQVIGIANHLTNEPDTVEAYNAMHVLGQSFQGRPLKVVDDGNDVTLAVQGSNNLLKCPCKK